MSLAPTHVRPVRHTFRLPFCQPRLWTITERPQRLVTFETFHQSDEAKWASGVWRPENASWVLLYGGSNAWKCMMAAMLFKNIYRRSKWDICKQKSGVVGSHNCFWGCMEASMLENVWWKQCSSKIYTCTFPKCIFPKCIRLACLLSFARLLVTLLYLWCYPN